MSCGSMCINTCSGSVILWSIIRCVGTLFKLAWLVLGGDPAARSHRVEQFTEACNALGVSDGVIHSRISWRAVANCSHQDCCFFIVKRSLYVKGLRRRQCTQKVGSQGIHVHMALEQPYTSSVVSVLISVTTDISNWRLACHINFCWGSHRAAGSFHSPKACLEAFLGADGFLHVSMSVRM